MNKPYYLFLDDERYPKQVTWVNLPLVEWVIVRNYNEFVQKIEEDGMPVFISFDHDLADEHYNKAMYENREYNKLYKSFKEKTGMDCARWLVNYCLDNDLKMCNYQAHTMNPVGKQNIESLLNNFNNR